MTSLVTPSYAQKPVLIIVGNHAPPYRILTDTKPTGLYIDPVREALGGQYQLEFRRMPFARALEEMRLGKADMMLGPNRTQEREKYLLFTSFAFPAVEKVFLQWRYASSLIDVENDLKGLRIGYVRGTSYGAILEKAGASGQPLNNLRATERLLITRRLDAMIMTRQEARHWVMDDILRTSPYSVPGKRSHIAIARKSPFSQDFLHIDAMMENLSEQQW